MNWAIEGGSILSFGNNMVSDNANNGAPTAPVIPLVKLLSR